MREIKFRGKVLEGGWEYATPKSDWWEQFWALVDMDTIGEYVGLKDKNGKEIYEGDIWVRRSAYIEGKILSTVVVEIDLKRNMFNGFREYQGEVIGNIHDNRDLLGEDEESEEEES